MTYTLLVFLMLEYGAQRIEKIGGFASPADCEVAAQAAREAWKTPKTQVRAVCVPADKIIVSRSGEPGTKTISQVVKKEVLPVAVHVSLPIGKPTYTPPVPPAEWVEP